MHIAVLSDSHDHLDLMRRAIAMAAERGITTGFHLGDFCAPPALMVLADSALTWYGVWGNVDGDRLLSYKRIEGRTNVDMATTDFRELELEGRKIFLTHYPEIARIAAISGEYDAVFHGHNHQKSSELVITNGGSHHETLLANPGEVAGFRYGTPTFGIYSTETNEFEIIEIC